VKRKDKDMSDTITITGNLAGDPELKHTAGGLAIASFRVGSGQRRFDRASKTWVDGDTNWYAVSAFRGLAEHAHASLRRGDRVVVSGRLRIRNWDNGTTRGTAVEIDADAVGHDLLWGTSVFTKAARPPAPAPEGDWEVPDAGEESWAPADDSATTTEAPSGDATVRPLALVGAEPPF
jgi:single-strand DNA-binding protein